MSIRNDVILHRFHLNAFMSYYINHDCNVDFTKIHDNPLNNVEDIIEVFYNNM